MTRTKECKYTEEQINRMLEQVTTHIGEIKLTPGSGVESGRRVRICRVMTVQELYTYSQQARSQMHCTGTVVNLMADFVLRETIQRLKAEGLFRQGTKKVCNELQGIIISWKTDMKSLLGERYEPMEDVAYDRMSELNGKIEQLRMQIKQAILAQGNKHAETASWVELTQQMFVLSHQVVKAVVINWCEAVAIDYSDVFSHMDFLRKCSRKWQKVCMSLYTYEQQVDIVQNDINVENALKILSHDACDYDGLWKHFQTTLDEHADVFSEEDRANVKADIEAVMENQEAKRKAAEKANADYWTKTRRTAKPRGSDVTEEDLQQLKQHFNNNGKSR